MSTATLTAASLFAGTGLSRPSRIVTAGLAWTAAGIHLALTPEHFDERTAYGLFFLGAALFQVALGWLLLRRPGPAVYRVGAYASLALIATWIVTRALVPPFSPEGSVEPVTLPGVLATASELATLFIIASALPQTGKSRLASRWAWGGAAGLAFTLLFLLASSAVSYVSWTNEDLRSSSSGFSLRSPFFIGMLLPHVRVTAPWSTLAFTALAGALVTANVVAAMGRAQRSLFCRPGRGVLAAAPALFAVSSCCGTSAALFLGVSATVPLLTVTPWLLLATVGLLSANLTLTLRATSARIRN